MSTPDSSKDIVVLGGSYAGVQTAHYILKHIVPSLQGSRHRVVVVDRSSHFFARVGAPRSIVSEQELRLDQTFFPIEDGFKAYSKDQFEFLQATATGLDTNARTISLTLPSGTTTSRSYYALVIATGSSALTPLLGLHGPHTTSVDAIKAFREALPKAKNIVIAGGGPSAVETAGEIGNFLNGSPGWFSTPPPKANITVITSADRILPVLRPSLATKAEHKLSKYGVKVVKGTKVVSTEPPNAGQLDFNASDPSKAFEPVINPAAVKLSTGEILKADLYIPAFGTPPNSSWLPKNLLSSSGHLLTNPETLRVDAAGSLVYAIGDISDVGSGGVLQLMNTLPVALNNLKRDLLRASTVADKPDTKPATKDAIYKHQPSETQVVPIGHGGGVGAAFGWLVPSFFVWLLKGRDYMSSGNPGMLRGDRQAKETVL